ncbi:MAG: adenylosuccinate lyase [Candidatus Freyarchaeota archaeon]|nr:adenylosuccinate lyase [Candidatus Jordarchaeia archaeon]MBS7269720.1 adenylosuccinate lyase [Candidatus Jordarchaeia archaeon]MBS7280954.1 adenylosuccinate lyase [Candidatus Jordarchaeia archaeon]
MSVHPIEYRYFTPEMKQVFTEENKLQKWLDVEAALARAHAALGDIPKEAAEEISKKASLKYVKLERVKELEEEIHHDVMAMVQALSEVCEGDAGKYVHLGATSYDIVDTAWALMLRDAIEIISSKLVSIKNVLLELASKHKETICIGRTHGQHAVPFTYGMKFAIWASEINRHLERIGEGKKRILVGKMSGAVGTMASFGKKGFDIQKTVMQELQIREAEITNQIVQRDAYAEIIFLNALIAATLTKIAKEIRNLQRTEIGEIFEPFTKRQVGSSTMAQKRNPHRSERVCGISRVIMAYTIPTLENAALIEHERDLTNSSNERIIFPESFILLDYILAEMISILKGLEFNYQNIQKNLELEGGLYMSENIMLKLVEKGLGRQEAHETLRQLAIKCRQENIPLKKAILEHPKLRTIVKEKELDNWLDPKQYIGTAVEQVEKLVNKLKN